MQLRRKHQHANSQTEEEAMIPKAPAVDRVEAAELNIQERKATTLRDDAKQEKTTSEILSSLHNSEIREQLVQVNQEKCLIETREEVSSDRKCLDERDGLEERDGNACEVREMSEPTGAEGPYSSQQERRISDSGESDPRDGEATDKSPKDSFESFLEVNDVVTGKNLLQQEQSIADDGETSSGAGRGAIKQFKESREFSHKRNDMDTAAGDESNSLQQKQSNSDEADMTPRVVKEKIEKFKETVETYIEQFEQNDIRQGFAEICEKCLNAAEETWKKISESDNFLSSGFSCADDDHSTRVSFSASGTNTGHTGRSLILSDHTCRSLKLEETITDENMKCLLDTEVRTHETPVEESKKTEREGADKSSPGYEFIKGIGLVVKDLAREAVKCTSEFQWDENLAEEDTQTTNSNKSLSDSVIKSQTEPSQKQDEDVSTAEKDQAKMGRTPEIDVVEETFKVPKNNHIQLNESASDSIRLQELTSVPVQLEEPSHDPEQSEESFPDPENCSVEKEEQNEEVKKKKVVQLTEPARPPLAEQEFRPSKKEKMPVMMRVAKKKQHGMFRSPIGKNFGDKSSASVSSRLSKSSISSRWSRASVSSRWSRSSTANKRIRGMAGGQIDLQRPGLLKKVLPARSKKDTKAEC